MKKTKVICAGEALIDRIFQSSNQKFKDFLGGAPATVSCALRKLNIDSAFIGCLGNDEFGKKLGKLLVITRGEKGSVAILKNEVFECNSKKNLKIVDLTGAGDLFAAGFLHGFINNLTIKESLEKGTEMSSKIIQKIGARL